MDSQKGWRAGVEEIDTNLTVAAVFAGDEATGKAHRRK
jgi:hypothetical protein